jgi:hypothetical protein
MVMIFFQSIFLNSDGKFLWYLSITLVSMVGIHLSKKNFLF